MTARKLWDAVGDGDEALVSQLIDQATVNWRSQDGGSTALHKAAWEGHTLMVTRLLSWIGRWLESGDEDC